MQIAVMGLETSLNSICVKPERASNTERYCAPDQMLVSYRRFVELAPVNANSWFAIAIDDDNGGSPRTLALLDDALQEPKVQLLLMTLCFMGEA